MIRYKQLSKEACLENIPDALKVRDQWVVTEDKKPSIPSRNWNDANEQLPFDTAIELANQGDREVAYVLHAEDPFVIVDFDDVVLDGSFSDEIIRIVDRLDTYTEISKSNTGLHSVCKGTRMPDRQVTGELSDQGKIEVFDADRYVVLTGKQLPEYSVISSSASTNDHKNLPIREIQRKYLPKRENPVKTDLDSSNSSFDVTEISEKSVEANVDDIKRTIDEYVKDGSDASKRLQKRWQSHSGTSLEFPSASEADLGFVSDLAFWARGDGQLIDKCFRRSNRMREKWDQVHYRDGRTYGEGTIQTAIQSNYDEFAGRYVLKK